MVMEIMGRKLLLVNPKDGDRPTITVELADKWYQIWMVRIIHDSITIISVKFDEVENEVKSKNYKAYGSAWCDHVINPQMVSQWCEENDYEIVPLAFELMVGRWEIEYHDRYRL